MASAKEMADQVRAQIQKLQDELKDLEKAEKAEGSQKPATEKLGKSFPGNE